MEKIHLLNGEIQDSYQIEQIEQSILQTIGKPLATQALLNAGEILSSRLAKGDAELEAILIRSGMEAEEAKATVCGLATAFSKSYMTEKICHELGRIDPFVFRRFNMEENILECYKPLGVLCHVAAGNAPGLGALSVLEGLMTGNINIVKLSSKENGFSALLLYRLIQSDATGTLKDYIYALDISSSEKETLKRLFDFASSIVAWGGTEAIESVRSMTQTPVIAWGHHLSFGYLTPKGLTDENLLGIARDICDGNQQACSSPQCLYYEGAYEELPAVAERLKKALETVSPQIPLMPMGSAEQAQITSSNLMVTLGSCMDEGELIEADDQTFRIYINRSPGLTPSPLFRTIWLKPMKREEMVSYFLPMSRFLQTVSLGCGLDELYELSELFTVCGATRIVECGSVFASYPGEPHDGVSALSCYCKRVSVISSQLEKIASFDQLKPYEPVTTQTPIMDKEAFMALPVREESGKLYVKSGGSSGKTILSPYSYRDYHFEMRCIAEALIAIGLQPKTDKVMNLFSVGHLYGGFISFGCILELANAKHYPMSEVSDTKEVVDYIVELGINTLVGMPSYLLKLFREHKAALQQYGGVKKLYYGGEFMTPADKEMLKKTFGVEIISSVSYGSNDVGPIGYTCEYCEGGIHHLATGIMDMEILRMDSDEPVEKGETGRIILSPKFREGHDVSRYEIGDLGRWIEDDCPCGRKNPRFELQGRYGDIFRVGGCFLNYMKLSGIINNYLEPTQLQLFIEDGEVERLIFRTGLVHFSREELIAALREQDSAFEEALDYGYLDVELSKMKEADMEYIGHSGKLKHIIDKRTLK
ncbi:phenylacetate-coenzyme A ligase PaaK-like adenylate-forming protein [Parabacteroides sp. PFB2-12]|uniref:acyl-CoA reductase n=1 Tax=unclassified Parabacteroides TaxID=2649774 RepID=UPI0024769826|nr:MULTISPECIES: acyl-CoA reductase [unclassified Parabacteroides]MDH6342234.1 phenylacetate-coenzyme A ligase PaaK-like adenylate-forming protein [Parabacteroides sp. PM6-13]MDH6391082.1 phenylacetate-coenzyme A ligase PaaK-like adenylate-forming protein [Parabacteroides sp. PFB2-12]